MNFLLRSTPARLVLWLPTITPSGFTIGIMKKSKTCLSFRDSKIFDIIDSIEKFEHVSAG